MKMKTILIAFALLLMVACGPAAFWEDDWNRGLNGVCDGIRVE